MLRRTGLLCGLLLLTSPCVAQQALCIHEPTIGRDSLFVLVDHAPRPTGAPSYPTSVSVSFRRHLDGTTYAFVAHDHDPDGGLTSSVFEIAAVDLLRSLEWPALRPECQEFLSKAPVNLIVRFPLPPGSHNVALDIVESSPPRPSRGPGVTQGERQQLYEAETVADVVAILGEPTNRVRLRLDYHTLAHCFGCDEAGLVRRLPDASMYERWEWNREHPRPTAFVEAGEGLDRRVLIVRFSQRGIVVYRVDGLIHPEQHIGTETIAR